MPYETFKAQDPNHSLPPRPPVPPFPPPPAPGLPVFDPPPPFARGALFSS